MPRLTNRPTQPLVSTSSVRLVEEERKTSRREPRPRSGLTGYESCQLQRFDPGFECEGLVERVHLVKERWLIDFLGLTVAEANHRDFWVIGCGGKGLAHGGHHFRLDNPNIPFKLSRVDLIMLKPELERRAFAMSAEGDRRLEVKLDLLYGERPRMGRAAA